MTTFDVRVTIENKHGISAPEGDTILNDLVLKGTHKTVSKIKTAKMLRNCGNNELWSFNYKKILQSIILFSCSTKDISNIFSVLRAELD